MFLKEKAKKGDPFAQHELGIRYILGVGVPIDTLLAADWIGKSCFKKSYQLQILIMV